MILLAKQNYYLTKFENANANTKLTWKLINQLLFKNYLHSSNQHIMVNNTLLTNNNDIAEHFNVLQILRKI